MNGRSGNVITCVSLPRCGEVDQRVAGHLVGEAGAAIAQDAALAVEQHQVADRDRLLEVALLLDVAALARAVAERLVLQRALTALVADRAVERVVGEQQLEHALLGALRWWPTRCRPSCPATRRSCTTAAGPGPRPVSTSTRHMPAHPHRRHARVVAEAWDVLPRPLGRGDHQLAGAGRERPPVDRDRHRVRIDGVGRVRRSSVGRAAPIDGRLDVIGSRAASGSRLATPGDGELGLGGHDGDPPTRR